MTPLFRVLAHAVVAVTVLFAGATTLDAQEWASWRGSENDGMARGDAPVVWDESVNVAWEVAIPGRGFSAPVVWGDQIFVTTAVQIGSPNASSQGTPTGTRPVGSPGGGTPSGRATAGIHPGGAQGFRGRGQFPHRDTGPQVAHRFLLLSINKNTGEVLWERTAIEATPHEGFHQQYGSFASHSPVTDGEYVFAYFGSRGVYCYDLKGNLIWHKNLGQMNKILQFGEGTPIVLHDDRVIIKFDHEGQSFIVALEKATGNELWRAARNEITSWSPPLVVDHGGRKQIVVAATQKVRSYDFETGDLIWEVAGLGRNQIPAPVHQDDLVYVMSGFIAPNLMAIRLGGLGDLTGTDAIVWSNKQANSYTPSPVLSDNQLFVLTDGGVLTNFNATTGEVHYRQRLPGAANFKASPVGVNGKLYLSSEEGNVFVVKMGPEFELLATNTLEDAVFIATPAIADGEIFLRSQNSLYRISDAN